MTNIPDPRDERFKTLHSDARADVREFMRGMSQLTKKDQPVAYMSSQHIAIREGFGVLLGMVREMQERVEKLEAEPRMKFAGTWKPDKSYSVGDCVTYAGGIWHGNIATKGFRPGTGSAWTLAVKRGTR
jgi:hypothetical protein